MNTADPNSRPIGQPTVWWRRRLWRIAASLVMTVLFAALAALLLDIETTFGALAAVDKSLLPLVLLAMAAVVLVRTLRVAVALGQRPSWPLLRAVALHGAAVAVLPAKLGEVILPLALNRLAGMSLAGATGLLFVLRIYDLLVLIVIGAFALAFTAAPLGLDALQVPATVAAVLACVAMFALPVMTRMLRGVLGRPLRRFPRLHDLFHRLSENLALLPAARIVQLICVSALMWGLIFTSLHCAALATDSAAGPVNSVLAGVAASLAFALPLNGVANFGPFEAAWIAVMVRAGIAPEVAAAGALAGHAGAIVVNVAAGGLALLLGRAIRLR